MLLKQGWFCQTHTCKLRILRIQHKTLVVLSGNETELQHFYERFTIDEQVTICFGDVYGQLFSLGGFLLKLHDIMLQLSFTTVTAIGFKTFVFHGFQALNLIEILHVETTNVDLLHVGQEVRLFCLEEVVEVLVGDDTHEEHVKVLQLIRISSLEVRQILMLALNIAHLLAEVDCDDVGKAVT